MGSFHQHTATTSTNYKMKEEMSSPPKYPTVNFGDKILWDRSSPSTPPQEEFFNPVQDSKQNILQYSSAQAVQDSKQNLSQYSNPRAVQYSKQSVSQFSNPQLSVINHVTSGRSTIDDQRSKTVPNESNEFLYIESKKARLEREKAEKRRRFEEDLSFDDSDLALASVPGQDFNPSQHSLNVEDLKPQPIVKKRKKITVPEEEKDDKYWSMRAKNNAATKAAREAKRLKENQIVLRAAFLEKDNHRIKVMLENLKVEHTKLCMEREEVKKKLLQAERKRSKFNKKRFI